MAKPKTPKSDKSAKPAAAPQAKAPGGKVAIMLDLLRQPGGASIEQLMSATGWQAHSCRGAMSGAIKKKLGIAVASEKAQEGRRYSVRAEPAGQAE